MTAWPFAHLEKSGADLIMADPPWTFRLWSQKGDAKSAQAQYETMTLADIQTRPVADLARPDAILGKKRI